MLLNRPLKNGYNKRMQIRGGLCVFYFVGGKKKGKVLFVSGKMIAGRVEV